MGYLLFIKSYASIHVLKSLCILLKTTLVAALLLPKVLAPLPVHQQNTPHYPPIIGNPLVTDVSQPVFPDFSSNYQAMVTQQEQAQQAALEAAQAAVAAQAAYDAQVQAQVVYAAPTQGSCGSWMAAAGISDPNAINVIMRESGCNPNAVNASSGACGVGQQLPCGKWPHQWNDPVGGLIDMNNYVLGVYGSWSNAWRHELYAGWY